MHDEIKVKEHFKELKKRTIYIAMTFLVLLGIGFGLSKALLPKLIEYYGISAYSFTPMESINAQLSGSMVFALVLSLPLILYQLYSFSKPALNEIKIKRYLVTSTILTILAFAIGITYFNKFLLNTLIQTSLFNQLTSITSILNLALTSALGLAISFNMVVIIPLVNKAGLIEYKKARKYYKHLIVVSLVIGALITPPDIISQVMVAVPLFSCSALGIFLTKFGGNK